MYNWSYFDQIFLLLYSAPLPRNILPAGLLDAREITSKGVHTEVILQSELGYILVDLGSSVNG